MDDIKHMEVSNQRGPLFKSLSNQQQQMEQERLSREQEEKDKAEKGSALVAHLHMFNVIHTWLV